MTETEPETIICKSCNEETSFEGSHYLDDVGDVCRSCYDDEIETCQLCGDDDVQKKHVSDFILCKAELSRTARRPPGIYRVLHYPFLTCSMLGGGFMHGYDVLFIDKLPKHDEHYEISGKICETCAKEFEQKRRDAYGRRPLKRFGFDKKGWELERAHTRATAVANPDMMRDLECGQDSTYWTELKETYEFPDLPTYHEWVFVEHQSVKVFYAGCKSADSWMTWHPEPRFRSGGHGPDCFSPGSLPNSEKHRAAYVTKHAKSLQKFMEPAFPDDNELKYWRERQIRDGITKPDNLDYWRERISHYDTERAIAKPVTIEAIELGYVRQDGVYDRRGKRTYYR